MTRSSEQGDEPVDAVVVSFRRRDLLLRCCAALRDAEPPCRLIVVDNASDDGSVDAVRRGFPDATVLENDRNVGFAAAVNAGVSAGTSPWLLLINSDAELRGGALRPLLDALRANPRSAAAGPRIVQPGGHLELSVGRTMSPPNEAAFKVLELLYAEGRGPVAGWIRRRYARRRRTRSLSAACMLLRRSAFEQVGGLDEDFFLYAEDVDLCRRLVDAGWELLYVPEARADHVRGASAGLDPLASELAYRRSQLTLYDKHHGALVRELLRGYLGLRYLAATLLTRGRSRRRKWRVLKECIRYRPPGGKP